MTPRIQFLLDTAAAYIWRIARTESEKQEDLQDLNPAFWSKDYACVYYDAGERLDAVLFQRVETDAWPVELPRVEFPAASKGEA